MYIYIYICIYIYIYIYTHIHMGTPNSASEKPWCHRYLLVSKLNTGGNLSSHSRHLGIQYAESNAVPL